MIGRSGKWPVKCGSLSVTHLMPTADLPISYSTTLSTKRNGYRWGKILLISSRLNIVLTVDVRAEISAAERGLVGASTTSLSLPYKRVSDDNCDDVCDSGAKALAVVASAATSRVTSFVMAADYFEGDPSPLQSTTRTRFSFILFLCTNLLER